MTSESDDDKLSRMVTACCWVQNLSVLDFSVDNLPGVQHIVYIMCVSLMALNQALGTYTKSGCEALKGTL